ncbi:Uncharacterized protein dnl_10020 [Desulfonema limicola]|uniref:Uncharacterized protein n=1 Tax=Desulfonema limicola TaxID=45656 RepID=A0A975B4R8_9BACT|nr:hypothetical protein [Desulfonema limicola]QTA78768.1 Uncharacterized protein dnl_10020 [Desulfonema limicola]
MNKRFILFAIILCFTARIASAETLSQKVERKYGAKTIEYYKKLINPGHLLSGKPQNIPEQTEPNAKALKNQTQEKVKALNPETGKMMNQAVKAQKTAFNLWGQQNKDKPILDALKIEKPEGN